VVDKSLDDIVAWALGVVDGHRLISVTGLRDGGSPWLVRYDARGGPGCAVVRVGEADMAGTHGFEVRSLALAAAAGIPVPGLMATRVDDEATLIMVEYVEGSSHQPVRPDPARLETLGRVAARISAAAVGDTHLPSVTRPIRLVDFDELRSRAPRQPLLEAATKRVRAHVPAGPVGFVHGDLWSGNSLWQGTELTAILDWDCAGLGPAGVDLGSLRCDAAMCYGPEAAALVLAGWEWEAGHPLESLAYWDAVAALSTPPDIDWFAGAIAGMTGRPDLTPEVLRQRRDAYLGDALDRLS
jgi:aminoglycoside phosphotransferase (APT) family kinase protein